MPKLFDQVKDIMRRRHYSRRTEQTYIHWMRQYILFYDKRHPRELGVAELTAFLSHLARVPSGLGFDAESGALLTPLPLP
jgi:hypothetical protein